MLVEQQGDEEGDANENVEEVNAGDTVKGDDSAAHGDVSAAHGEEGEETGEEKQGESIEAQ
nr:hypothetical protein [Tanacetum cinerariifolium]